MNIISLGYDSNEKSPEQLRRDRVEAKIDFWNFINEILPEIEKWRSSPEELSQELTKAAIKILHPSFQGSEIPNEVENMLLTLQVEKPESFLNVITNDIIQGITEKLKRLL